MEKRDQTASFAQLLGCLDCLHPRWSSDSIRLRKESHHQILRYTVLHCSIMSDQLKLPPRTFSRSHCNQILLCMYIYYVCFCENWGAGTWLEDRTHLILCHKASKQKHHYCNHQNFKTKRTKQLENKKNCNNSEPFHQKHKHLPEARSATTSHLQRNATEDVLFLQHVQSDIFWGLGWAIRWDLDAGSRWLSLFACH